MFWHCHPRGAVRLFEVAACRQGCAAIEDTDIVKAEEAALEHVLSRAVLAVYPPGEVQEELAEDALEELKVTSPAALAPYGIEKSSPRRTGGFTSPKFHS
jgi:hypothetical protein